MAFVKKPDQEGQFPRLTNMMTQPSAQPSKRIGTEAPVGAAAGGPSAGKAPADFTKSKQTSPGSVFSRQLAGADISGITNLAEQPLKREAGQEALRVKGEADQYRQFIKDFIGKQPQFKFTEKVKEGDKEVDKDVTADIIKNISAGGEDYERALKILQQSGIEVPKLEIGDVKEFTPMQALRGGSVESLLRKEATGPYSTGMAGLDALLFAKKGGSKDLAAKGMTLRATEQAAADALEKSATEESQKQETDFLTGQQTALKAGIESGIGGISGTYTAAPEGGISKVNEETRRLADEYAKHVQGLQSQRQTFVDTQMAALKNQALENMIAKLRQENLAAQEAAGSTRATGVSGDVSLRIPQRSELLAAAEQDPRYLNALRRIDAAASGAGTRGQIQAGAIPQVGLENVISEEDAARYNRLQELIGGKGVTRAQASYKPAAYSQQEIMDYFRSLQPFAGV